MSNNYQKNKQSILKYMRTSEKYKQYKKNYDIEYRKKNSVYASFISTKSQLYKKYGKEIGEVMLLCYLLKQKAKGYDVKPFLSKLKKI